MKYTQIKIEKDKVAATADLARAIVSATNEENDEVSIKDATKVIRGLREGILLLIESGYREIKLGNIAIIKVATQDEYIGRNPKTQEQVIVPSKLRVMPRFSKILKKMVSDYEINIGNDVIVQINKDKEIRSERAKAVYAKRKAAGGGFANTRKKTVKVEETEEDMD